jgi:hypothetical protein
MSLLELVEECKNRHITMDVIRRDDELHLRYRDPYHLMTDEFLAQLRQHKAALLDIVMQQQVVVPDRAR